MFVFVQKKKTEEEEEKGRSREREEKCASLLIARLKLNQTGFVFDKQKAASLRH